MSAEDIVDFFSDGDQLTTWLVVAGVLVTLVALAMTMFRDDTLARRMKLGRRRARAHPRARARAHEGDGHRSARQARACAISNSSPS